MCEKAPVQNVPTRHEVPENQTWDLTPLYATPEAWEADFHRLDAETAPVLAWQGRLDSAEAVAGLLAAETTLDRLLERLYTFAHLRHDEDTANTENQAREARIRARYTEIAAQCAWISPELLSHPESELRAWMASPAIPPEGRRKLELTLRNKPHVLSGAEETLLAAAGEVLSAGEQTYSLMTNADMEFPDVRDSEGTAHPLTEGTYRTHLESPDRPLRRAAFETLLGGYGRWKNTLASTLSATVKEHLFLARVRHFPSALEAALFDDQIPARVYDGLISSTRAALPLYGRYLDLRRRALGLDALDMYDLYTPLVPSCAETVSPEKARAWVEAACAPLGPDYADLLRTAFDSRWIDWPENKGKRSGAYSSGCYDSPPYLLLNHHGRLDDAFTLAHELGHSMHTAMANRAQPHRLASYPIFLAEIASTVNELLLTHHLLAGAGEGTPFRAHLLNHLCDSYKGTLFRQTMFAEFERDIHVAEEEGEALTAGFLCDRYAALNRAWHPGLNPHPDIAFEWCRIPHFYYDFYVYKYATSFCAALVFARRLREGRGVDAYLGLLRSGGSRDPLEAVAAAGVDLADPAVYAEAFAGFEETLRSLEGVLPAGNS